ATPLPWVTQTDPTTGKQVPVTAGQLINPQAIIQTALLQPLQTFLAQNAAATPDQVVAYLASLPALTVGGLQVTLDFSGGGSGFSSDFSQVVYNVTVHAQGAVLRNVNLGSAADAYGLTFATAPQWGIGVDYHFNLTFGYSTDPSLPP